MSDPWIFERVVGVFDQLLLSPASRLFYGYLACAAVIALLPYWLYTARAKRSVGGFVRYLAPREVYAHRSFRVDVMLVTFNGIALPALASVYALSIVEWSGLVATGLTAWLPEPVPPAEWPLAGKLLAGLALFALDDFARFLWHRACHGSSFLWRFHSVHHSAEHLNPLTTWRFRPFDTIFENMCSIVLVGTVIGIVQAVGGVSAINFHQTVVWVLYVQLFNVLGGNLRHTHIWVSWGPWFSHVFSSPAQHQIHHSSDARHRDKNFTLCLFVWDWMFGTLYVPKGKEDLKFGLSGEANHRSLCDALLRPLRWQPGIARHHDGFANTQTLQDRHG